MRTHTQTIASFFSVAMAATLLGALFTTQVRRPRPAEASTAAEAALAQVPRAGGSALTLDTFRDIARASNAGVVNINTSKIVRRPRFRDPFFDFFGFGDDGTQDPGGQDSERARLRSLGSGFVIDADGSILTNRHVIEGADEIRVSFPNGKRYDAKIVGQDARTDVALIKIEPKEALTVLPLGDSDRVEVGEWVMAVGNPFDLGGNSVTVGVVSFKGRDLQLGVRNTSVDMIQTDAAINPGNSGGPLINTRGEVVGINTLIITDGISRANAGVGFSVPINVAKGILPQLRSKGRVDRGWMGVVIGNVSEALAKTYGLSEAKGALVNSVTPGSPAEKAGIKPEEVVLAVDGRPVADSGDLARYISSKAPGTVVKLEVLSVKGERRSVSVTLGTFQDDTQERAERERDTARLGMTLRDLTGPMAERLDLPPSARGVMVMSVETGEAAEEAGIVRGDVIVSVNGTPVADTDAFERAIDEARPNGAARLRVLNRRLGDRVVVLELK